MGINPGELGTHRFRNVTETMVPYGCIVSPTTALLCIRCVWSMGIFKEIYLKYESSGDQYVGRCASSLYQKINSFSPHFFGFSSLQNLQEDHGKSQLDVWLKDEFHQ